MYSIESGKSSFRGNFLRKLAKIFGPVFRQNFDGVANPWFGKPQWLSPLFHFAAVVSKHLQQNKTGEVKVGSGQLPLRPVGLCFASA